RLEDRGQASATPDADRTAAMGHEARRLRPDDTDAGTVAVQGRHQPVVAVHPDRHQVLRRDLPKRLTLAWIEGQHEPSLGGGHEPAAFTPHRPGRLTQLIPGEQPSA